MIHQIKKSKIILKFKNQNNNYQTVLKKSFNSANKNINKVNNEKEISIESNYLSLNEQKNKINRIKEKEKEKEIKDIRYSTNSPLDIEKESGLMKNILFPYRYYLCSIFIKHGDISIKSLFLTRKFKAVYNFIFKLFDISSYLIMQKEFEILKNNFLLDKYRDNLVSNQKYNKNALNFNVNMKEFFKTKQFSFSIRKNDL